MIDTSGKTDYSAPPVITDLTIKNITYNIPQIQLRFKVNEDIRGQPTD